MKFHDLHAIEKIIYGSMAHGMDDDLLMWQIFENTTSILCCKNT